MKLPPSISFLCSWKFLSTMYEKYVRHFSRWIIAEKKNSTINTKKKCARWIHLISYDVPCLRNQLFPCFYAHFVERVLVCVYAVESEWINGKILPTTCMMEIIMQFHTCALGHWWLPQRERAEGLRRKSFHIECDEKKFNKKFLREISVFNKVSSYETQVDQH